MDKTIRIDYNLIGYNVTDKKYFLRAFGKTALNEDGWTIIDSSARKDTLMEPVENLLEGAE